MAALGVETETNIAPLVEIIVLSANSSAPVSPDKKGIDLFLFGQWTLTEMLRSSAMLRYGDALHIASGKFL